MATESLHLNILHANSAGQGIERRTRASLDCFIANLFDDPVSTDPPPDCSTRAGALDPTGGNGLKRPPD
jgi:hypothetical protein